MAATYATALQFKTKFERYGEYDDAVIDEYLEEAESTDIIPQAGDFLDTIAGNANGLIALKHITLGIAHDYLTYRQEAGVRSATRAIAASKAEGKTLGDRARASLTAWIKWAMGQSGSLHTEKLTNSPTFNMKEPETWWIDAVEDDD